MNLAVWLGELSPAEFVARYFGKLPLAMRQTASAWSRYGEWDVWGKVLSSPQADVLVVRQGRQWEGPAPTSAAAAQQLSGEGYTLLVRHAERHDAGLGELAAEFAEEFAAATNLHLYATPPGQFGFGWHYDAEEVFIVQVRGQKEYALRKNTVHPWPLEETLPPDMQYEREIMPLMRCLLAAGDWLYIPSGYWHRAETVGDDVAMSLALGVMPRTAMDVFDALRPRLLPSLLWRQRLPVVGRAAGKSPEELRQAYREVFRQLAGDLEKLLQDESLLQKFLEA